MKMDGVLADKIIIRFVNETPRTFPDKPRPSRQLVHAPILTDPFEFSRDLQEHTPTASKNRRQTIARKTVIKLANEIQDFISFCCNSSHFQRAHTNHEKRVNSRSSQLQ